MANFKLIRNLVEKQKVSINDLAKHLHMTPQGLQKIIRINSTNTDTIEKISQFLNVPVGYFFDETETALSEPEEKYQTLNKSTCHECIEKERLIRQLQDQLKDKERLIQVLENKGNQKEAC